MEIILKKLRQSKSLTQVEASKFLGIPLRTYINYENNKDKKNTIKYKYILEKLNSYGYIDEEHGVLNIEEIKEKSFEILKKYNVEYCYLFGSYAKGKANRNSDIDLIVSSSLKGLKFYGLAEELRESLHKKIDLLNIEQLNNNYSLVKEILRYGIRIYG